MKKRIVDLRTQGPIPDIANYSRPGPWVVFIEDKLVNIASTVCRVPEGMVKVSGGGRTLQLGAHSAASESAWQPSPRPSSGRFGECRRDRRLSAGVAYRLWSRDREENSCYFRGITSSS